MTVPFMRAYTELLVKTCHRRGAHAMGGMAALIPSRKDAEANERAIAAVAADKEREAGAGFDGTWVAHPDVVAAAMEEFDKVLGDRPNQVDRQRDDVDVGAAELLDVAVTPGDDHRGRAAQRRQRRHPVHLVVAARQRRRRHLRPDGGRGHGRDLALAGVAVDPPRAQLEDGGPDHAPSSSRAPGGRGARAHPLARSATTSGSSARAARRSRGRSSSRSRWPTSFAEFLTLPAYEQLD